MSFANINNGSLSSSSLDGLVSNKFSINKELRESLFGDRLFLISLIVCFAFFIFQLLILFIRIRQLPPEVPLYYSRPWGDDILASRRMLWVIPVISFVFNALNFSLGKYFFSKDKFLLRILAGFNCVLAFSAFWVVFKIASLLI